MFSCYYQNSLLSFCPLMHLPPPAPASLPWPPFSPLTPPRHPSHPLASHYLPLATLSSPLPSPPATWERQDINMVTETGRMDGANWPYKHTRFWNADTRAGRLCHRSLCTVCTVGQTPSAFIQSFSIFHRLCPSKGLISSSNEEIYTFVCVSWSVCLFYLFLSF